MFKDVTLASCVKPSTTWHIVFIYLFFLIHFQQKIIELKVKEYKELAQHAQSEMEKLVWSISYMYIFVFF